MIWYDMVWYHVLYSVLSGDVAIKKGVDVSFEHWGWKSHIEPQHFSGLKQSSPLEPNYPFAQLKGSGTDLLELHM